MNHTQHKAILNFIWSITDNVLRDVYTRNKYRNIIFSLMDKYCSSDTNVGPDSTKDKDGTYLIYGPTGGSSGMLTETENLLKEIVSQ